jgi:mono/diheme cytochrome c family protein
MKRDLWKIALCAAAVAATSTVIAADKIDIGKREYDANCAVCHGLDAKGDGFYRPYLTKSPTDLTVLAKQNGGVFPMARVYDVIDGRNVVTAHGSREMPIWGRSYSIKAAEYYMDVPYDSDAYVRARILALAEYLNRVQAK